MLHSRRIWSLVEAELTETLAFDLSQRVWPGCHAVAFCGYVFANDSTSPDGAQEFAVLKPHPDGEVFVQIDSITFSWCNESRAKEWIELVSSGTFDIHDLARVSRDRFQVPAAHGACPLCR